ncbi:phosphotransferase [Paenibacillus sp. CN-4]|uniref:phosphotransferase n=1 Tax=Paenibacillus nanchangensis TaxID=3348343 RepID=UPI00397BA002
MPINHDELLEVLKDQGITDVIQIQRKPAAVRSRSSLSTVEARRKDGTLLSFVEKSTEADYIPFENRMYTYFSGKKVPIPKVWHNTYDAASSEGIVLLEDLTPGYRDLSDWKVPVDSCRVEELVEAIAAFHAATWEAADLPMPEHLASVQAYMTHLSYLERDYLLFKADQAFGMEEAALEVYEQSLAGLRRMADKRVERVNRYQNTVFIHGDLNVCNLLYPLHDKTGPRILDLEAVKVGLCTEDLVMLFVHDLFHGGEETQCIFDTYYRELCRRIGSGYSYSQFTEDI